MTDGSTDGQPLTPEQEEAVSRMLAAAAGPVAMPPDVTARLDGVLTDLQGERGTADVVELRTRRRWPRVLLAAAAVVIGGYAVGSFAAQGTLSGSAGDAASSDSSVAQEDTLLADEPAEQEAQEGGGGFSADSDTGAAGGSGDQADAEQAPGLSSQRSMMRETLRLRSDRLEVGVLRALRVLDARPGAGTSPDPTEDKVEDPACPAPELTSRERALDVRYDGARAVLVTGPERSGTVEATVYSCSGEVLDSTSVRP